ncbi:MAG: C4-dicarboxylate ABC transporter [Spirochaeta sp. LUC14_002_19_P3]|nr:MAG: C4-dicarboxylate ABC transporter [Spirochaeta sp. LUC14_002_19_P3]
MNMNEHVHIHAEENDLAEAQRIADEAEGGTRHIKKGAGTWLVPGLAALWSIFQLLLPSFILLDSTIVRSIHLTFAIVLVFLTHPMIKKPRGGKLMAYLGARDRITILDYITAILAGAAAFYIAFELFLYQINPEFQSIVSRQGVPINRDLIFGVLLTILLLEAARRSLGPALAIVAFVFILYSFMAAKMPLALSFKSVSLTKYISKMTISTEGIYGIPLYVSANIVFLFVLFGALLEKAGAGQYFVDLAFSLMGRFRGGPAKAAVLASGLTGMVSGSSIANTVTTGTFTIPLMKKVGYPDYKAGAVEVAVSTNGQLMPPIMGAAAFIIAETVNIPYIEVIKAAFIPAVISYIALLYIVHLEASKLGIMGMPKEELPRFFPTLLGGLHFIIPVVFLVVELVVFRHTPNLAAFRAILALMVIIPLENLWMAYRSDEGLKAGWKAALHKALRQIWDALVSGGKNMMGIGVAVAAAGIIVGVVTFGLGGIITEAIEFLAGGRFFLILIITAISSLILGMGLPTTATYIVMAALTAPVIVELGANNGVFFPLIAAHLFVFFFGILADDTPPVGLAAFAAAAIAKSDPIKTGVQGFSYDIRTAILPFIFMFNTDLLLYQVKKPSYAIWVFLTAMMAMFAFAALTQGYLRTKLRWWEYLVLLGVSFGLLMPHLISEWLIIPFMPAHPFTQGRGPTILIGAIALLCFALLYLQQFLRGGGKTAVRV